MSVLNTSFAKLNIRINHRYGHIARICRGYMADGAEDVPEGSAGGKCDVEVEVTDSDIDRESTIMAENGGGRLDPSRGEAMAIFRKIAESIPECGCFLMHGSAVAVDGEGYIFIAPSGTGKSTHVSLWRKAFGERAVMINDDKPFIRVEPEGIFICGTPWNGKHGLGANICVPLKAICLLERGEQNVICRISTYEAFPTLLKQTYRPYDPEAMKLTLSLLDRVSQTAGLYKLQCNMDPEAANVSYTGMNAGTAG